MNLVKGLQRYQRSKLEVHKNICQRSRTRVHQFELEESADIFVDLQLSSLISLQTLDQKQSLVPHLKDPLHTYLEPENQGNGMTFKVFNLGSK